MQRDDPIIELVRIGHAVRVTAIDPSSLVEVTLQAPAGLDPATLARAATAKLRYRLARLPPAGLQT